MPRFRLREDQAGDNCYYLGFLFTLISLAFALYTFAKSSGKEETSVIEDIVGDFGIALTSTILGLALRVVFNQMRQDPVEVEREARRELADAAQRLRSELDQTVLQMNHFRRATQQSIAEGLEELHAKVANLLEKTLARYDEVTTLSAERIQQTLAACDDNARLLNEAAGNTVYAVDGMAESIKAVKLPEDLFETRFAPAASAVSEIVAELRQQAGTGSKEFAQLHRAIAGASAAAARLEEGVTSIAWVLERVKPLKDMLDGAEDRLGVLTTDLEETGKVLAGAAAAWRETLEREAEGMKTTLEETGKAATETATEFRRAMVEPAGKARAALSSIAQQGDIIREMTDHLSQLTAEFQKLSEALARLREESRTRTFFGSIFRR